MSLEFWPVIVGVAVISAQWGAVMIRLKTLEKTVDRLKTKVE